MSGQNPREIAIEILGRRGANEFTEEVFERILAANPLPTKDRGLCQELVYGITRNQSALDWLIGRKTANREQPAALRNLLRLGLYQIFWTDRIPGHAAVNETVELSKRRGFGPKAGFVNAVLRGYLRELVPTRDALGALRDSEPWTAFSHPEWLVKRWIERWGRDAALRLLQWNNAPPENFARVNTLKVEPGALLEQWREENVEYDFVRKDWFEENVVFKLKQHPPLHRLDSFRQGKFYVQDPSTLLAVHELDPRPGTTALDLCAAPGGKLTYMAQKMRGEGKIIGTEISPERIDLARSNCERLGVAIVELAPAEMSRPERFDRVLIDAPCSNTGVMRRRVDLRWRIKPEEIERLRTTQLDLLTRGAALLKPGGLLVYSTCSIEPEENQQVTQGFLARHPALRLENERGLLPFVSGTDGAYVARFAHQ